MKASWSGQRDMRPVRTSATSPRCSSAAPAAVQVLRRDRVAVGQAVGPCTPATSSSTAGSDDRRIHAADPPGPAAEMLLRRPAVPEVAVVAEVVEAADVRPDVRVHRDRRARVLVPLALRRVRQPDVVLRVAQPRPRRHAHEVVDGEVERPARRRRGRVPPPATRASSRPGARSHPPTTWTRSTIRGVCSSVSRTPHIVFAASSSAARAASSTSPVDVQVDLEVADVGRLLVALQARLRRDDRAGGVDPACRRAAPAPAAWSAGTGRARRPPGRTRRGRHRCRRGWRGCRRGRASRGRAR